MFFQKAEKPQAAPRERSVFALAPFRIEPKFVHRVWGYRDLRPWYDRVATGEPIGEVWLTGDECEVATGPHAGMSLGDVFEEAPEALLGQGRSSGGSPLLIKVLFAREKLSVQVHPDDKLAQKYGEPRGKTECWYVLDAKPGAEVAAGLKAGVTMADVKRGIDDGTLENSLNMVPLDRGDLVYVDAGTVHAIWPGSILLEAQQNSDLTYRMFDYGRGRELHLEKSLEAARLVTRAGKVSPKVLEDRTILVDSDYFCMERIPVEVSRSSPTLSRSNETTPGLAYLFAAAGNGRLSSPSFETVDLPARGLVAIPASSPVFAIQDLGDLDLIRISPRWPEPAA
jgi:mannose-6-phosphate isomerase